MSVDCAHSTRWERIQLSPFTQSYSTEYMRGSCAAEAGAQRSGIRVGLGTHPFKGRSAFKFSRVFFATSCLAVQKKGLSLRLSFLPPAINLCPPPSVAQSTHPKHSIQNLLPRIDLLCHRSPPKMNPYTNTREEFTTALLQRPIPDTADDKWKQLNRTLKDLAQKLLEHDAMRQNKVQPFMTPAANKNRVYFLWDSTTRLLVSSRYETTWLPLPRCLLARGLTRRTNRMPCTKSPRKKQLGTARPRKSGSSTASKSPSTLPA